MIIIISELRFHYIFQQQIKIIIFELFSSYGNHMKQHNVAKGGFEVLREQQTAYERQQM